MDPTVLHTLEATAVFSCPDLIMMQNFSMMDLLWKEGRGGRDTRTKLSLLKHKDLPELSSLISTGFLERRNDRQ